MPTCGRRLGSERRPAIHACKVGTGMGLPSVIPATGAAANTVHASAGGVHSPLQKLRGVVYNGSPPCDPKTLVICKDQRREISAWIRTREVASFHPQCFPVLGTPRPWNFLFLQGFINLLRFLSNI